LRKIVYGLVLAAWLLACYVPALAAEPSPSPSPSPEPTAAPVQNPAFTIEAALGYDGLLLLARWMPAFVTVTNDGDDFEGVLAVNGFKTTTDYDRYELPVTLPGGATKRFVLPVRAQQMQQDMYAFELVRGGKIVAEQRVKPSRMAAPETVLVGLLSSDARALSYMNTQQGSTDTRQGERWIAAALTPDMFPGTDALMDAFSMLVVDGVDVRTLSEAQQRVLAAWLRRGGVVFVSGGAKAASGYPFFEPFTGLRAGGLGEAEDITPQLLAHAAIKGTPAGEPVWLSEIPGDRALVLTEDGDGLIAMARAEEGLVLTAAFDLAGKPIHTWPNMSSFWPRLLKQDALRTYDMLLSRLNAYTGYDGYRTTSLIGQMPIQNNESSIAIFALLFAYLALAGFAGYAVMKRLDAREWLWALVPAAAVVFALVFALMSRASTMNKPVALTATRMLLRDGVADTVAHVGISTAAGGELSVSIGDTLPNVVTSDYYYYESGPYGNTRSLFRPVNLQQRITFGDAPTIGFAKSTPWARRYFQQHGQRLLSGRIDARVWVEADGIHGEITNGTDMTLTDCLVVSRVGYCVIDTLLPGQRAQVALLVPDEPLDIRKFDSSAAEPGVMYGALGIDPASLSSSHSTYDLYAFIYAAYSQEQPFNKGRDDLALRMQLTNMFEETFQFYNSNSKFYLIALTDGVRPPEIMINGAPAVRRGDISILGTEMDFQPIGPDGHVFFPEGYIRFEQMIDQGEDKPPRAQTADDSDDSYGDYYYNHLDLSKAIAGRCVLPDFGKYTVDRMTLLAVTYEAPPELYLYDHEKGEWVRQRFLSVSMDGAGWAPYIGEDGTVYVRYVPSELNRYSSLTMPTLSLRGEVK